MNPLFHLIFHLCFIGTILVSHGCASTPETPPPAMVSEPTAPENDFEDPFQGPKRWNNLIEHYEFDCPVNGLQLEKAVNVNFNGLNFIIDGSTMRLENQDWGNNLKIGILAGIEDPGARTLANLRYAAGTFKKRQVDIVLINGDMGGSRDDIFRYEIAGSLISFSPSFFIRAIRNQPLC